MIGDGLTTQMTHLPRRSVVSENELRAHATAIETRHLLLAAVHATGDLSLLERFVHRLPAVDSVFTRATSRQDPAADPPALREELLEILCSVLTREDQSDYLHPDDPDVFAALASVALGIPIDETQVPMCMEQSGFVPDRRVIPPTKRPPEGFDLAIVGAGMTGLDAAVKASSRELGHTIYAMEEGLGGLWWSQRYPGVAVDTPSLYYSFSWEISPQWTKLYPLGDEYRAYLNRLAQKYDVASHVKHSSKVLKMEWLEDEHEWEMTILDLVDETTSTARHTAVLTAAGQFGRPKFPDVPGREDFAGEQMHTAAWRDVDLANKRVAVVGVGAAGVQVIAALAPVVEQMTVFQRQAHWVIPNFLPDGGKVSESELWLRLNVPYYVQWTRFVDFYCTNLLSWEMVAVDEEWTKTHSTSISALNDHLRQMCLAYINGTFGEGSELAGKLTPDFPVSGKRPVRETGDVAPGGYYWAYLQPHVHLVTDGIARVVPEGIVTDDGTLHELDVIVWATGMTLDFLSTIDIVGRDGIRLGDVWANQNPRSYLGGAVPGFPNLFVNDGPNTSIATGGGGHNFMAETINHYIFECLQLLIEREASAIEVTKEAHDRHNERIDEELQRFIWSHEHTAHTYFRNAAGRLIFPNPFPVNDYWTMCLAPDASAFLIHERSRSADVAR
jgi:4-hydroxyacetophenone monooxygenase